MNGDGICRLCLKLILNDTFEPLDRSKSRMLKVLFHKWDDDVIKDAIICSNCIKSIHLSYDFKISCIFNVDHLKTDICNNTSKDYLTLDADDIKSEEKIACQFCLNYFEKNSFIDLSMNREVTLKEMLEKCLPEIDIKITENILMCQNCMAYLQIQFDFVISCLDNEEKIRQFCSSQTHKNLIDILECIKNFKQLENSRNNADIKEENANAEDYRPDVLSQVQKLEKVEVINHELDVSDDVKIDIKEESNETVTERTEKNFEQFQCPYCEYESIYKYNMKSHIRNVHEMKNLVLFSCQLCSFKTPYKCNLQTHQLTHDNIKMFQCPGCQKCFNLKQTMDNHLLSKHDDLCNLVTSKIYACSDCSYKTVRNSVLLNHVNAIHSKLKKYQCDYCSHTFVQKSNLKQHISSVHLNIRPFICTDCKKTFTQKVQLDSHISLLHLNTRPFICTDCKKTFSKKVHLDSHIISHHQKNLDLVKTVTNKISYCDHCTYTSVIKRSMVKHIKTHHSHKTFHSSCNI